MKSNINTNRLIQEKSPYLLQHAHNPVDWYPWSDEAFEKAQEEDKPVFLSIGYSTCHWCHVMEHESFEDAEVANLMNDAFISIKVDREERPDIDNIYMTVCQMMTGGGGWPLTIIMTPGKKPFFSGTYFPKNSRYGRIGMTDLIKKISTVWKNDRTKVLDSAEQITGYLQGLSENDEKAELNVEIFTKAYSHLEKRFDENSGGFGNSPKFPSPQNLLFLLRYWKRTSDNRALDMVVKTLTKMRLGGVYDHIGFGFHRYSTDDKWLLPHFEKMLYDQAMLIIAYTETFQATKNTFFKQTAEEIIEYVLRDMTHPEGGFYSAEDADSEGEEGKFYTWKAKEIDELLNEEDAEIFKSIYNLKSEGNFAEESTRMLNGTNIPHLNKTIAELSKDLHTTGEELTSRLNNIREKLFNEREKRIHPLKDDKILTDWNGLMIAALSKAGSVFGEPKYIDAAIKAVRFIEKYLRNEKGELLHRFRGGDAKLNAHNDDYAFFIWGLLELYGATFDHEFINKTIHYQEIHINKFWDKENHGFFFTANDSEKLLVRTKEIYDGAIPSGNSAALNNLIVISRLTGQNHFEDFVTKMIDSFSASITKTPYGFAQMLCGLDHVLNKSFEIVIASKNQKDAELFIENLNNEFIPNKVVLLVTDENRKVMNEIAPYTPEFSIAKNKSTVYVCKNYQCSLPVNDPGKMMKLLSK
ncbi:MAG: thioredoxin domain-containing protein [Melioribacteraceae bacterium]|nr:thioredoxin domain-containing protein [Melioribacteraceae bacterium]MCF8354489.1 thioredoxin domain-containing protein [Melioribacteraceae bacterium]MCF8394099.1 thioredoxin domain-containing protein [Melioribacteraceae bacterium]MCF8419849.1 thioredoxin domain-containing protein [Melioribacteraceae bacterium]